MPRVPTAQTLCRLGVDLKDARKLRRLLKETDDDRTLRRLEKDYPWTLRWVHACYNPPRQADINRSMVIELLDVMHHSWCALRSEEAEVSHYWQDTVALYLSCDDSYDETLIYEVERERYVVASLEDYVEKQDRKGILLK